MNLGLRVILRLCLSLIITLVVVFLPAGTWRSWRGWILLTVVFTCLSNAFLYLYRHDRQLLERRMRGKEKISEQRRLVRMWRVGFFAILLLPGFDYRFEWSRRLLGAVPPPWLSVLSDAAVLAGMAFVFWVLRVNSFASRTIELQAGQRVISSGPYALVRHPMYLGSIVLLLFVPLALGSYVTLPAFAFAVPFYVARLLNEERFLRAELPGYSEYCLNTRFRLIPYVW